MSSKIAHKTTSFLAINKSIGKKTKKSNEAANKKCHYKGCNQDNNKEVRCHMCDHHFCNDHLDSSRTDFCMTCIETNTSFCEDCVRNYKDSDHYRMKHNSRTTKPFHVFVCEGCDKEICNKCVKTNDDDVPVVYCYDCFQEQ